jgi:hypothetical protein
METAKKYAKPISTYASVKFPPTAVWARRTTDMGTETTGADNASLEQRFSENQVGRHQ